MDIFGKNIAVSPGPIGRAETFEVYIGQTGGNASIFVGLAQGVQCSYNQPLQRIYELGSFNAYMVSGRSIGNMSITRLVGKALGDTGGASAASPTLVSLFARAGGGVGNANPFFNVDGGAGGRMVFIERTSGAKWTANGCYVTQESTGVDANGILVSEQIAIEFHSLEMDTGNAVANPNQAQRKQG
jgi:hypothetical protein